MSEGKPHDWVKIAGHEVGNSHDWYSQCARCNMFRHDYEYTQNGERKTSPNYPDFWLGGMRVADKGCTRGDMTEDEALLGGGQ